MVLVVGSFEKEAQAEQALVRLRGAGLSEDESILIANARPASRTGDGRPQRRDRPRVRGGPRSRPRRAPMR